MTMRTYEYFVCPNGHQGEEKTSENDQPYSKSWERVSIRRVNDTLSCYTSSCCCGGRQVSRAFPLDFSMRIALALFRVARGHDSEGAGATRLRRLRHCSSGII